MDIVDLRFETQDDFLDKLKVGKHNYYNYAREIIDRKVDNVPKVFTFLLNKIKNIKSNKAALQYLILSAIRNAMINTLKIIFEAGIRVIDIVKAFLLGLRHENNEELFNLLKKYVSPLINIKESEYSQILIRITKMKDTTTLSNVFDALVDNAFMYKAFLQFLKENEINKYTITDKRLKEMINYLDKGADPNLLNIFETLCRIDFISTCINGIERKVVDIGHYLQSFIDKGANVNAVSPGYPIDTFKLLVANGLNDEHIYQYLQDMIDEYRFITTDDTIIERTSEVELKETLLYIVMTISTIVEIGKIEKDLLDGDILQLISE